MFGDIGDYVEATAKEIGHHPLQALGAALGVPGYDPFFGGLFNNHSGGALLSPTGNFTSSAWNDMYKNSPNSKAGLDAFNRINGVADVVAPVIAGGYGAGAASGSGGFFGLGGGDASGAGANGLTGLFSGPSAYGDSGLTGVVSADGSGLGTAMGGDLGGSLGSSPTGLFSGLLPGGGMTDTASGALGGGLSGDVAGSSSIGGASMGGLNTGGLANFAQQVLKQQSNAASQRAQQAQSQRDQSGNYAQPQAVLLAPPRTTPTVNSQLLGQLLLNRTAASWGGA